MRAATVLAVLAVLLFAMTVADSFASRWDDMGSFATKAIALEPTPAGESHIGLVESGKWVAMRFPVPAEEPAGYWLSLGNIVAYTGKGSSYQLVLRRDADNGPVVHQGPVIPNGDQWNADNATPIDLTDALTVADRQRGYLDIFATGLVEGDGWTIYRSNPGRPIFAYVAMLTAQTEQAMAAAKVLRERGISIIPIPKRIQPRRSEDLRLGPASRIVYSSRAPESLAFAARELQAIIRERTGLEAAIATADTTQPGDIRLALASPDEPQADGQQALGHREGYVVNVATQGATITGGGEAGCFYGAMTLGQMVQKAEDGGGLVPACTIEDWPTFPYRIIQYDIARGQTVNVQYVKRIIRELARCKVNALLFYMEDDFRFRKYPFLGREGTFTHEKAQELAAYARQYRMQLIPQFEALGHAAALLGHEELRDLREAGDPWVFCTSEPQTWEFLDDVFGELVQAFPTTEFIHVGGDEFEFSFGKCPRCKAKIAAEGIGALYAEHMNRLNQLVKKRGKIMMFWPSHGGPTPELSFLTLKYQDRLEKDCIPTEWIYHGPAAYPEIQQYQQAGFRDVFCCPAVESYSRVWPDYVTTFRGIRGFYRAGEERGCGGAYCTTWEFMFGALVENSWYGLIFAAECSWSPASTPKSEFNRRFADWWWGLRGQAVPEGIEHTISEPLPAQGDAATWRNRALVRQVLWAAPDRVMREFSLKQKGIADKGEALISAMDQALARADELAQQATRNHLTLRAAKLAFRMMRYAGQKLATFQQGTALYGEAAAVAKDAAAAGPKLQQVARLLSDLRNEAAALADEYRYFVDNCGAWIGDWQNLDAQRALLTTLAHRTVELADKVQRGQITQLPPGAELGFLTGRYEELGRWEPEQMSQTQTTLRFDATRLLTGPATIQVEWQYTSGAHGLSISRTQLLCNGQVVSEDAHAGWSGAGTSGNVYSLKLDSYDPHARYEVVGTVASHGGTDSRGIVWLVLP